MDITPHVGCAGLGPYFPDREVSALDTHFNLTLTMLRKDME